MPWKFITTMVFFSIFWHRLLTSFAVLDPQDHKAIWLFKFSATVVVGIAVAAYVWRRTKGRLENSREVDNAEGSELTCFCGLPAKLRVSRTSKNPYRLFYNCPKNLHHHQCEFFCWSDEISTNLERYIEEKSFLRDECIRLQQRIDYFQSRRRREKSTWDRIRTNLRSQLLAVKSELDDINNKIQEVNESEIMPPLDETYHVDDEHDGAVIVRAIE